jgi:putative transposase
MSKSPDPHYRHRFPAELISHAVWLYHVFSLSFRGIELLLAERGVIVSYESVRQWCLKFGASFADKMRRRRPKPGDKWHLDEVLILSANSGDWSQGCKARYACFGPWLSIQPMDHP